MRWVDRGAMADSYTPKARHLLGNRAAGRHIRARRTMPAARVGLVCGRPQCPPPSASVASLHRNRTAPGRASVWD
jgi:hypothetical protein